MRLHQADTASAEFRFFAWNGVTYSPPALVEYVPLVPTISFAGEEMSTSGTRIDNIRVKIQRARKYVDEAATFIESYLDKKPFVVSYKRDPNTRRLVYFVSSVQEPDPQLSGMVGDALHNLRSALDHIAYQLVLIGTGKAPSRRVYFPIWDSQAKYEAEGRSQIDGARPEAVTAVDAIKPYKGGCTGEL